MKQCVKFDNRLFRRRQQQHNKVAVKPLRSSKKRNQLLLAIERFARVMSLCVECVSFDAKEIGCGKSGEIPILCNMI